MPYSLIKDIAEQIELKEPIFSKLKNDRFAKNNVEVFMLRLDQIHPIISGNKIFKLSYFLEEAKKSGHKKIITFGGAFSNHLAATAFACKELKIKSLGIVRGERPKIFSHTLLFCLQNEMQLEFIPRSAYQKKDEKFFLSELENKYQKHTLIPEGGFSIMGKQGAAKINKYFADKNFTHVCLAVGTATTFAGIVDENKSETEIIGFSVLKKLDDIEKRFAELKVNPKKKYSFINHYHFGGYVKKTEDLISFMNHFYEHNLIPLDFVYTAKMMFGVNDLIHKKYFAEGSKILCIHTGGLQGNRSLPQGTLAF